MGLPAASRPESQARPDPSTQQDHGAATVATPSAKQQDRQRPPNGFANENPQTPGQRPRLQIQLDPNFRAAGEKSAFFRAFIVAHDKMSRGEVVDMGDDAAQTRSVL